MELYSGRQCQAHQSGKGRKNKKSGIACRLNKGNNKKEGENPLFLSFAMPKVLAPSFPYHNLLSGNGIFILHLQIVNIWRKVFCGEVQYFVG
jgi:hypothetical protein